MEIRPTIVRLLLVVPLLVAGLSLGAPRPAAAASSCTTDIFGGTIKESLVVPAGTECRLFGVVVRGGVTVEPGAIFEAVDGTEIRGSVTATEPFGINLTSAVVRGDVRVTGGPVLMSIFQIVSSQVRGNLVVTGAFGSNPSGAIVVVGNTVRGNLVLQGNTARQEIIVRGNVIEANLDCSGNAPEPIQGDSNTVGGVATGQCAGLVTP